MGDAAVMELGVQLEGLTARLDEQAARIAHLEAENARLTIKETLAVGGGSPPVVEGTARATSRRGMLKSALAAGAAVTALAVSKVEPAHAGTRTTLFPDAASLYGAAVTYPASRNPATDLPPLGGFIQGLIATDVSTALGPQANSSLCGVANTFVGVQGTSRTNTGVLGYSTNFYGVFARSVNSAALAATSPNYAAIFTGDVYVTGRLTVASGAKSAAVKRKDGSTARVYCQESPEPWFEDFGEATLTNGSTEVGLDPGFDELVVDDKYQVFLSEYDNLGGLYVGERKEHSFVVKSRTGASGPFGYRLVALRRDRVGERLERITPPKTPELPKVTVEAKK